MVPDHKRRVLGLRPVCGVRLMDAGTTNSIGRMLQSLRMEDESDLIVSFAAHGPSYDCRNGSVSATIRRGSDEATSEAVSLIDALLLARAKLNDLAAKREAEKAKAQVPPAPAATSAASITEDVAQGGVGSRLPEGSK